MKALPLYPAWPALEVEAERDRRDTTDTCTRCNLRDGVKTVCMAPEGEPGGLLVLGDYPGREEDARGRPMVGSTGDYLRKQIARWWSGPIAIDNHIRCSPGGREIADKHIDACRTYTAGVLREVAPERVLLCGAKAIQGFTGRSVQPMSVRKGYVWLDGKTPAFLLMNPVNALRNRFLRAYFESDLEHALTAQLVPPVWGKDGPRALLVTNAQEAAVATNALRHGVAVWDVESAGQLFCANYRLLCVGAGLMGARDVYVWTEEGLADVGARAELVRWLSDPAAQGLGQNVKYDRVAALATLGVLSNGYAGDVRLWRKLLEPEADARLATMAELVGLGGHKGEQHDAEEDALARVRTVLKREAKEAKSKNLKLFPEEASAFGVDKPLEQFIRERQDNKDAWIKALVPKRTLYVYNARDCYATAQLAQLLKPQLDAQPNLARIWNATVLPVSEAIAQVEAWGIAVDRDRLQAFDSYLGALVSGAEKTLVGYASINWGSRDQIAKFLFETCGLKTDRKTDTGKMSTDEETLLELKGQHPCVDALLDLRQLDKLKGAYAGGLFQYICDDGRIHPNFLLDGARCLPAGELVMTSRGYVPAESVDVGDLVLTHEGRARRVSALHQNGVKAIYRVSLANGMALRSTGNHEYMTARGWVRADALTVSDSVSTYGRPEEWRPIEGWPYEVSSWGRVRYDKARAQEAKIARVWEGNAQRKLQPKYRGTGQGHLRVTLKRGDRKTGSGNKKDFPVHRLVLAAFGGPPTGPEARHLNGIPWDNTVGNLAWGTPHENRQDARRHGSMLRATGKLTLEQVAWAQSVPKVRSKRARGAGTDAALAGVLGVSREMVRDIRNGKRWTDMRSDEEIERRVSFSWSTVTGVEMEPLPAATYGLTVEDDHSHVTGGIVTHNSGRPSMNEPNLLNIPSEKNDPKDGPYYGRMARDVFVAVRGHKLVSIDFAGMELRVAAGLSKDEDMKQIFVDNVDYHQRTAEYICKQAWGIEPHQVEKKHRQIAKCFHPDTEVLTRAGWKKIQDLAKGEEVVQAHPGATAEDVTLDWAVPTEVFTKKNEHGHLVHLYNEGCDLRVTPEHRMLEWTQQKRTPKGRGIRNRPCRVAYNRVATPDDFGKDGTAWANAGVLDPDDFWFNEQLTRLAVATQADGSIDSSGAVRFGFTKPRKIARMESLLEGVEHTRGKSKNGRNPDVTWFRIAKPFASTVLSLLDAKRFSWRALGWPLRMRRVLLEEAEFWDSHRGAASKAYSFASAIKQNHDVLQAVAAISGRKTRFGSNGTTVRARASSKGGSLKKTHEPYDGIVSCLSVPSTFVLVRDRGVTMITGQSCNFMILYGGSLYAIAHVCKCTIREAEAVYEAIFGKFKKLKAFCERSLSDARKSGVTYTHWQGERARCRPMWRIADQEKDVRETAERGSWNTDVQGTASEYCLNALAKCVNWIREDFVPAKLVLTVYDQLLFEVREDAVAEVVRNASRLMCEEPLPNDVPLNVDVDWGDSWGSLSAWSEKE